jgi:hypothetical protein
VHTHPSVQRVVTHLEQLIVSRLLAHRAAILDGFLELGGLGDHGDGDFRGLRKVVVWLGLWEEDWRFWLGG